MDINVRQLFQSCIDGHIHEVNRLLPVVDVNIRGPNNWQPIHCAANHGRTDVVELLLNTGRVDVDSLGYKNQTALDYAVWKKHFSIIELLLLNKASCNILNDYGYSAFHLSLHKFLKCCYCSDKAICPHFDQIQNCPLIYEAYNSFPKIMTTKCVFIALAALMISKFGADISIVDERCRTVPQLIPNNYYGWSQLRAYLTSLSKSSLENNPNCDQEQVFVDELLMRTSPLHIAILNDDFAEVKRVTGICDLNEKGDFGNTAIHLAVEHNNGKILKYLLENGADINAVNDYRKSALHIAVTRLSLGCMLLLLQKKCDTSCKMQRLNGYTALMDAVTMNIPTDLSVQWKQEQLINVLVGNDNNVDIFVDNGFNCAHLAANVGNVLALNAFIKHCPTILSSCDKFGNKPLHRASMKGHSAFVNTLLESGAVDVNDSGFGNFTALHFAVIHSKFSTTEVLVMHKAKVNAVDDSFRTPLHYVFRQFNDCCSKNESDTCEMSSKIADCVEILKTFVNFPDELRKKCVYLAVTKFLITKSEADAFIRDSKGVAAIDVIKGGDVDRNSIFAYLTGLDMSKSGIYKTRKNLSSLKHNLRETDEYGEYLEQMLVKQTSNKLISTQITINTKLNPSFVDNYDLRLCNKEDDSVKGIKQRSQLRTDLVIATRLLAKKDKEKEQLTQDVKMLQNCIKEKKKEIDTLKIKVAYLDEFV